ncbi:hypothetical protein L3Q82_005377 [Scortum barcoo]|uniref:Uncharacterized protein n=1 Tax=Scortum barcoo TaxID=214431 RepID=A0ACB8VD05_9TELE|nr:hypothetical protein L3Q82_005377 [Scortum barcoo]
MEEPTTVVEPEQRRRRRKRGSRVGRSPSPSPLRKRENRPPLPSILLANVQSLDNKLDELRSRMAFQRDIKNCNVLVFTETTWLDPSIPDSAIVTEGLSIHRQDRTINSGKSKGGGVCFVMVNNKWCSDVEIISTGCSPDLEHLMIRCRPYYLPREFTSVVMMTAVYVPPQVADNNKAMDELFSEQKLKRDGPVTRTIQQWSDQSDSALRDCFSTTEWCVFKDTDINTHTDAVIGYIGKCIDDASYRGLLCRHSPIRSPGLMAEKSVPNLKHGQTPTTQVIWRSTGSPGTRSGESHQQRKETVQGQSGVSLQGLQHQEHVGWIKNSYGRKISSAEVMSASLPDELNTFYARFESTSPAGEVQKAQEDHCPPVISRADVCRTLKRINTRKAPGPDDGIPGPSSQALTSTIMKCFERSTEDAISLTLHTALSHLDQRDTYVRMLFIDYSSAFNTIVPSKLVTKLRDLGLNSALCDWILILTS